jgi:hypothetical protein
VNTRSRRSLSVEESLVDLVRQKKKQKTKNKKQKNKNKTKKKKKKKQKNFTTSRLFWAWLCCAWR